MIKINVINGQPQEKPQGKFLAIYCDNEYYYYCETKEDVSLYVPPITIVDSKNELLEKLKTSTPSEIAEIKTILGI